MKNMNRYLSLVALIISLISCQSEDNPNRYELIPYPNDMEQMSGRFSFDDDTQIFISPECGDEVNEILAQFAEQFGKTAGKDLKIAEKEGKSKTSIHESLVSAIKNFKKFYETPDQNGGATGN